ncbi:MAG: ExbD/TolR family protein [Xanthomonadales bacterium]|nr:ExbD/TolR family protein [Xanthomonadales bacterium]
MAARRQRRKLKAEINVVPYIDVTLVLLIIFMITAPLLNLGVDIELPRSDARSLNVDSEPVLVTVDQAGAIFLTLGGEAREAVDAQTLVAKVGAFVRNNPQVPVLVGGDGRVDYQQVYQALVLLQQAEVGKVGLMSQPNPTTPAGN